MRSKESQPNKEEKSFQKVINDLTLFPSPCQGEGLRERLKEAQLIGLNN